MEVKLDRFVTSPSFAHTLLTGPIAARLCMSRAREVQARACELSGLSGYGARLTGGAGRMHAVVYTGNMAAIWDNFHNQTLAKAAGKQQKKR